MESCYISTRAVEDIANRFFSTIQQSNVLPQAYLNEVEEKMEKDVRGLLQSPKPKIMVYGIYNSGKSTLVNALCGKAVAQVADRPMTDRIAEYDTGKYILVDSPGVDAPEEHEQIADEQLSKCHMILFVVSSKGGFESRQNYQKMLHIIDMGVPFYIILNDRGTVLSSDPIQRQQEQQRHQAELEEIRRKIISNLIQVSGNQRIDQKYDVIVLNAKRAWTGIERDRPGLVQESNISALRLRINKILEDQGALLWLKTPLFTLDFCMGATESKLYALEGHDDYSNERQALKVKTDVICNMLADQIKNLVYDRFNSVYAFYCGLESQGLEQIGEQLVQDIQSAYQRAVAPLSLYIKEKFPGLRQDADGRFYCEVPDRSDGKMHRNQSSPAKNVDRDFFDLPKTSESSIASDILDVAGMAVLGTAAYDTATAALGSTALGSTVTAATTALSSTVLGTAVTGAAGAASGALASVMAAPLPIALLGIATNQILKSSKKRQAEEARWKQMQAQIDTTYDAILQALDADILKQQQSEQEVQQMLQSLGVLRSELHTLKLKIN